MENEKQVITIDELKKMSEIDIRTVDKHTLANADDLQIQADLPQQERIADYIRQIKNPYCYLSHGMIIKISFAGKDTLERCLERCMSIEMGKQK